MLLRAIGGRAQNLDFQKLLFLYCQQEAASGLYEFVPHRFGAFSFTSYADRRKLIERGLLADEERHWTLTNRGNKAVGSDQDLFVSAFVSGLPAKKGKHLVAETYRRFPYYAIRSEIAEELLRDDEVSRNRIEGSRPHPTPSRLFTIGYEGKTLERYLNNLLQSGITLLCDVRRNPISRKYGFARSTLAASCAHVGIRYEHLPELGIPSSKRRNLSTEKDYKALFADYARLDLPKEGLALGRIVGWLRAGESVALTCFEHAPEQCHRRCVADAIKSKSGQAFKATDL